ncbi:MAG: hypothetical protein OXH01_01300 [Bacteroidetes bacterium]|nr:hypothetical protein [Bacteroidota bacterium]
MKQFFALASIFFMSLLMIAQNAEAQRDSLRVEKEMVISADGDTMIVTKTFPMRVNIASPMHGRGVFVSADGDTMIVTRRYPGRASDMVIRADRSDPIYVEEEVMVSADGDTIMVTQRPLRQVRDIVVWGERSHPLYGAGVVVSVNGDTLMATNNPPKRNRKGDLEVETFIERAMVNSDGDTTMVTIWTETDREEWVRRSRTGHQMRHRFRGEEEEVITSADGDTMIVTERPLSRARDMVVWGERSHPLYGAGVVVRVNGDTLMATNNPPRRNRKGDLEAETFIERVMVNSDGDSTMVTIWTKGDPEERVERSRTVRQIRNRLRQRSGSRKQIRMRDVRRERGDSGELREMEVEARRLARQLRQTDEESYQEKEEMLREQLEKIFDYKQAMKMKELDQKRRDNEEQRKIMEERQTNREAIIKDRINQLLGRGSSYDW